MSETDRQVLAKPVDYQYVAAQRLYCNLPAGKAQAHVPLRHISIAQHKVGRRSAANHVNGFAKRQRNTLMQTMENVEFDGTTLLRRSVGRRAQ